MSEPFLAEIRIMGFNFAPRGWAFCDGQILPISQNQSLYSLLGTIYGGDGRTSFALPDMRSRTPIHVGNDHMEGQRSGAETVTLTAAEIASHNHIVRASGSLANNNEIDDDGVAHVLARSTTPYLAYRPPEAASTTALRSGAIANTGGGQAHDNMQPFLTLTFCIALQGLFPSRS